VKSALRVASPPAKPLLIYDGECNFCVLWMRRLQHSSGEHLDYLPFQDPRLAVDFPELSREQSETAVQLIEADGKVYSAAEALFRALAHNPHHQWLFHWYEYSPAFARATEWAYRFVAGHRRFFSALTRLGWGRHVEPPSHFLMRRVFLRSLALIYLIAFTSLWVQIAGLVGSNGILPVSLTVQSLRQQADAQKVGWNRYHLLPTLCWLNSSDRFLKVQCAAGAALAVVLMIGIAPALCLLLLWLIYLSLTTACLEFLGFQWDNLLLETGLLAIFFAPLTVTLSGLRTTALSRVVLWLLRWLLFRLMFQSGCVKLLSGDRSWRSLSALRVHYETQPLPTWIGWFAHQLPLWAQQSSTAVMFSLELGIPFLIFAPRRLRQLACIAFIVFQACILLTGNYCFFNLLTIALCLVLCDDAALCKLVPKRWRTSPGPSPDPPSHGLRGTLGPSDSPNSPAAALAALSACNTGGGYEPTQRGGEGDEGPRVRVSNWPVFVIAPITAIVLCISLMEFSAMFRIRIPWPAPLLAVYEWESPLRSVNNYGLFAVMTTSRPEIIVEGSNDGLTWLEYEFKYKPGDVKQRPRFVEPHQPRLDWQMWFAALSNYQHNRWFINFCIRLLQGRAEVLALLQRNPFPDHPPRYVRAVLYEYHFTNFAGRRKTGAWWRRERKGTYLPALSLEAQR